MTERAIHLTDEPKKPYWKRAHHDWKFWVAMFLMFAALAMYILSNDLSMVPRWR